MKKDYKADFYIAWARNKKKKIPNCKQILDFCVFYAVA